MFVTIVVIVILSVTFFAIEQYFYTYWSRCGVPSLKPCIPYGNIRSVALKKESFGVAVNNLYHRVGSRLVGIYLFYRPAILIRDAHLAHRIMTTDFKYFYDRGVYCNEKGDPFSAHLFTLQGQKWRALRSKFTPLFSTGELRIMLPTILYAGRKLQNHLMPMAGKNEIVDIRAVVSRFVQEIIANIFFGYEPNCINDPTDEFAVFMNSFQRDSFSINFRYTAMFLCPSLLKFTGISAIEPKLIDFVTNIINQQIEEREKYRICQRNDFIQQLINLRRDDGTNDEPWLSLGQCAANIFLFYTAGTETSAAAISFTLHELTHNPHIMEKLRNEIDEAFLKSEGVLDFNVINKMHYLDLCLKETLRKYPGLPILNRECTEDYQVPDSDTIIRKGTQVIIPLLGYGMTEKYFPDASRYSPERFDVGSKNFDEKAYFPFGDGPRQCIAARLGRIISKVGLVMLLSAFKFKATRNSEINFMPSAISLVPRGGIPLRVSKRF